MLYVVALDCCFEILIEDDTTNSMMESLDIFEALIKDQHFKNGKFVMFFTKKDQFKTALQS